MSKVGYKKPPKHTQFGAGESGNPIGKTSEQRRLEIENAERATRLHNRMLAGLEAELEQAEDSGDKESVKMITANILKLIKDAQDRGLGSPEQLIDHRSRDQSMTPQAITRTVIDPKANDNA
ncbi:MAG: hypothetical protein ACPGSI_15330 [Pikeienuella sp.]